MLRGSGYQKDLLSKPRTPRVNPQTLLSIVTDSEGPTVMQRGAVRGWQWCRDMKSSVYNNYTITATLRQRGTRKHQIKMCNHQTRVTDTNLILDTNFILTSSIYQETGHYEQCCVRWSHSQHKTNTQAHTNWQAPNQKRNLPSWGAWFRTSHFAYQDYSSGGQTVHPNLQRITFLLIIIGPFQFICIMLYCFLLFNLLYVYIFV